MKCLRNFLGLNLKGPYLSLEKEKYNNFCLVFTYSIKRVCRIRKFHVAVVQRLKRIVQKSVMNVQSCCLLIKTCYFLPFSVSSSSSLVLFSSRNSAAMVTWRHTSPLFPNSYEQSINLRRNTMQVVYYSCIFASKNVLLTECVCFFFWCRACLTPHVGQRSRIMKICVCTSKFIYRCALIRSHNVIVEFLSLIF